MYRQPNIQLYISFENLFVHECNQTEFMPNAKQIQPNKQYSRPVCAEPVQLGLLM
jgi:hypothetical protein